METSVTNGILVILDSEKEDESNRLKKHPLVCLLQFTGLYFGNKKDGRFWYYFGIFRALLLVFLVGYQSSYMGYYLLSIDKVDEKTPATIFLCSFKFQGAFVIIFLIYWQHNGQLSHLFETINWPPRDDFSTLRSIKRAIIILIISLVVFLLLMGSVTYHVATGQQKYLVNDLETMDAYYFKSLRPFFVVINYLNFHVWWIVLFIYVIFCIILHGKFIRFNKELEEIGQQTNEYALSEQLLEKYTKHIRMARMVKNVDNTFEVYTFVMIGLNIPTSIFSLISVFSVKTPELFFLLIPAPIFCILQLIGLTAIPARVHTAIQEVRNILYNNTNIWKPYDEKTYQIASVFVSHVDHANLGISVWGFAIVTKPLILTTISLTITYLTILLQLQIKESRVFEPEIRNTSTMTF